jgi:hypothetical protein
MQDLVATRIYPLIEKVFDEIVIAAGGNRAHPDHDRRTKRGADYVLGTAIIELKILEDEGLDKAPRQKKLARIFTSLAPNRPVHVLDRCLLDDARRREYDRALEGPLKQAVKSAKDQLVQSRLEYPHTTQSILMIVNNGNTALDHHEIIELLSHRAKNDTNQIDGIIVAGAYIHSDGFDTIALWPIDYIPLRTNIAFQEYDALREAFHKYAERSMTAAIIETPSEAMTKGPALDSSFDLNQITFVKPAPPLGYRSDFYIYGRPRLNSTGIETSPTVATIFPELSSTEWARFHETLPLEQRFGNSYQDWLKEREQALKQGTPLKPLVPISITFEHWLASLNNEIPERPFQSICTFATREFQKRVTRVIDNAQSIEKLPTLPNRFILAWTQQIGQDEANDVSEILLVERSPGLEFRTTFLVQDARIFHRHSCTLGAAYAVKYNVDALLGKEDITYAWT